MQHRTKKYLLDIESALEEIENVVDYCDHNFEVFQSNPLAIRSLERLLEIVGEATKKLLESDSTIQIQHSNRIIALRNRLAHAYDSIELGVIWGIALKDVPELKNELSKLN